MRDGTNKRSDSENSAVTPLHAQPPMTMMSSGDNDDFFYQFDYKDDANSGMSGTWIAIDLRCLIALVALPYRSYSVRYEKSGYART